MSAGKFCVDRSATLLARTPPRYRENAVLQFLRSMLVAFILTLARRLFGRRPWPSLTFKQEIFMELFEQMSSGFADESFEVLRADERNMVRPPSNEYPVTEDRVSVPPLDLRGAWLRPKDGSRPERALIWLHGGAYVMGSVDAVRDLLQRITIAGECVTFAIDYRLAPEHPCPAGVEDAVAAYRFVRDAGYAAEDITLGGDSAGGGLVVAALVALREAGEPLPGGAVLVSPWVDLDSEALRTHRSGFIKLARRAAVAYAGDLDPHDPRVSPLFADLSGLPPAMLHFGGAEPFAPEQRALGEAWAKAGSPMTAVEWEDMPHDFPMMGGIFPPADAAVEAIGRFVSRLG